MADLLPQVALPKVPFDPADLAEGAREVWLEVGFGGGEHLAAQATLHPEVLVLGAEIFVNGVASLLRHIEEGALTNVRIHPGDARELMANLPAGGIERLYVLFPDPWPKARHHKRRLIQAPFVREAARILRPAGVLRFATDWADYAEGALHELLACAELAWTAAAADDWRRPPEDHAPTRYERKRLGDCAPIWLEFVRL
jgi:tRNA (guanine-N7-)-methyltransferase